MEPIPPSKSKGKEKVLSNFSFNNDGLLSPEAIRIIEEGTLKAYSKEFGKVVIDMDARVAEGLSVKDVLESAVLGSLDSLKALLLPAQVRAPGSLKISEPVIYADKEVDRNNHPNSELMEVEEVFLETALTKNGK